MKKNLIIIFFVGVLFFLMTFFFKQNVEFVLLDVYSNNKIDFKGDVELINDLEKLDELLSNNYNIDTDVSTVILSKKKIKKIMLIPKYKLFPIFTHFIKIYCEKDIKNNKIYIYYLPNDKVYFDERNNPKNQIVYW